MTDFRTFYNEIADKTLEILAMRWPLRRQIMLPMAAIMLLTVVVLGGVGAVAVGAGHEGAYRDADRRRRADSGRIEFPADRRRAAANERAFRRGDGGCRSIAAESFPRAVRPSDFTAMIAPRRRQTTGRSSLATRSWIRTRIFPYRCAARWSPGRRSRARRCNFLPRSRLPPRVAACRLSVAGVYRRRTAGGDAAGGATASRISRRMSRLQGQVDRIARGDFQQLRARPIAMMRFARWARP